MGKESRKDTKLLSRNNKIMNNFFNINFEFDNNIIKKRINDIITTNGKGYVGVVDANVLTIAQKKTDYLQIVNNSILNICDGSSITWLAGLIYKKQYLSKNGPEFFKDYIESEYNQLILGNTQNIVEKVKAKLNTIKTDNKHVQYLSLPFLNVDEFNYIEIADKINKINPDIIWVSLGAPKQEIFISKIIDYINRGVLVGIGAAINIYIGEISIPNKKFGALKFIWLNRIFHEPKKQLNRIIPYLLILPKIIYYEIKKEK